MPARESGEEEESNESEDDGNDAAKTVSLKFARRLGERMLTGGRGTLRRF